MIPPETDGILDGHVDAARHRGSPSDVPIGAVVVDADGAELARAGNARERLGDPTAHAEILALRAAAARHGDGWRLSGCTLAVTVEPCTMCAGALVLARIDRVVFGAWEPKTGAVGSLWDVVRDRRLNHRPDGACVFLGPNNRCRIHAKHGSAAKPLACRIYPYSLVPAGDHWKLGLRFACPSAAENAGRPLADHLAEAREYAAVLEADAGTAAVTVPPPPLQGSQAVTWADLARTVKEQVRIAEVLELRGIEITWHGREGHSPCPICRDGVDRFVIWPGPPDRAWCRRCHASNGSRMDVIALVRSTVSGCEGFHAAVAWLADLARVSRGGRS